MTVHFGLKKTKRISRGISFQKSHVEVKMLGLLNDFNWKKVFLLKVG